jgi:hypothetical protein
MPAPQLDDGNITSSHDDEAAFTMVVRRQATCGEDAMTLFRHCYWLLLLRRQ